MKSKPFAFTPIFFVCMQIIFKYAKRYAKKSKMAIKQKIKKGSLRMEIEHFTMTYK